MVAATADINVSPEETVPSLPVSASTTIYKGTMVCLDADGYAVPAADTSGYSGVVGVALEGRNNSSGSDGATKVPIISGRVFRFTATSLAQTDVGQIMYVVDDQTIDDDPGSTNKIPAGFLVEFVSTTAGKIFIPIGGWHVRMNIKSV